MERKTFGQPIASYQGVSFLLADMAMGEKLVFFYTKFAQITEISIYAGIEASRLCYQYAAWLNDQGIRNTYMASIAKCMAGDVANKCATDAVQVR